MQLYQAFAILGSLVLLVLVVEFIRRGILKEKYSVLWLASAAAIIILAVKRDLLDRLSGLLGIGYPPSFLFLVAFLFVLLIILHFSVVISILHERNKTLAQELTLLKNAVEESGPKARGAGEAKKG